VAAEAENWQAWLDQHGKGLLLLARQFLATPAEAEDAVQSGFIRFWPSRHTARDPAAYLYACVRSAALDQLRANRRHRDHRNSHPAAESAPLLNAPVELDERRRTIEESLTHLPPDQREVLVLKIWADLTFSQIAQALNISPNTAASRYRYALQAIESLLTKEFKNA